MRRLIILLFVIINFHLFGQDRLNRIYHVKFDSNLNYKEYTESLKKEIKNTQEIDLINQLNYKIGYCYLFLNQIDSAINYLKSYNPEEFQKRYHFIEIANLYEKNENYNKSIKYLLKAKNEVEVHTGTIFLQRSDLDFKIALDYIKLKEYEKALNILLPQIIINEQYYIYFHFNNPEEVYDFYKSMVDKTIELIEIKMSINEFKNGFNRNLDNVEIVNDTLQTKIWSGDSIIIKNEMLNYGFIKINDQKIKICEKRSLLYQDEAIKNDKSYNFEECKSELEKSYFYRRINEN